MSGLGWCEREDKTVSKGGKGLAERATPRDGTTPGGWAGKTLGTDESIHHDGLFHPSSINLLNAQK